MTATQNEASAMTARDHALRVAVLDALQDTVDKAYKAARKEAEPVFKAARIDGQTQQKVLLPDGEEIGLISIRSGSPGVTMAEADLEGWVREHCPDGIEDYIDPAAVANLDVIEVVRAVFPHLVKSRIRQSVRDALLKEIKDTGGWLVDEVTAEKAKIAEVTTHQPTGTFSYRAGAGTPQRIVAEWLAGNLAGVDLGGMLALSPAAGDGNG